VIYGHRYPFFQVQVQKQPAANTEQATFMLPPLGGIICHVTCFAVAAGAHKGGVRPIDVCLRPLSIIKSPKRECIGLLGPLLIFSFNITLEE